MKFRDIEKQKIISRILKKLPLKNYISSRLFKIQSKLFKGNFTQ